MKTRLFILVLFILLAGCAPDTGSDPVLSVSADKMNVLYLGVENPVTVAVSGIASSDLEVMIDNGEIKGENGKYLVLPAEAGEAVIKVTKGDKDLGEAVFRVKVIPDPVAAIAGMTEGTITLEKLLAREGVDVLFPIDFDISFTIKSFTLTIQDRGYDIGKESDSDRFTSGQKELIASLKPGRKLYVTGIIAVGPDSAERKLPPIILTIGE